MASVAEQIDPGFRRAASGLIVPEGVSRIRRVLTKAQSKQIGRLIQNVLKPEEIRFVFICERPGCPESRIERVRLGGHIVLRCGCTDRIMETAF